MTELAKKHWPPIVAAAVLLATVTAFYLTSLAQNDGRLVYALDDAYIHTAMAANFAEHSVWGVTRYGFSSASSSPLWTLMLAGTFYLFGVIEAAPLVLNALAAVAVLILTYAILLRHTANRRAIFAVLLVVVFLIPLPTLIFAGMEHTVQVLINVAFAYLAAELLSREKTGASRRFGRGELALAILAALVMAVRYEGMFLVGIVCLLALLRGRVLLSIVVAAGAAAPVVAYGLISLAHGWHFFPNSIILKGQTPDLFTPSGALRFLLHGSDDSTLKIPRVLTLIAMIGLVALFRSSRADGLWRRHTLMIVIFATAALLQIQFAKVGWFYRYEAYLLALFIVTGAVCVLEDLATKDVRLDRRILGQHKFATAVITLGLAVFLLRGALALKETTQAMHDRCLEHIAMARFVERYYDGQLLMVNDIGAICHYTNARVLDMFGLASLEPVAFRKKPDGYTAADVHAWAVEQGVRVAILSVEWDEVAPRIPEQWTLVGLWRLPQNVVFGTTAVGFLAIDPSAVDELAANFKDFAANVSPEVAQKGLRPDPAYVNR
mgnify:FL=1